MSEEEYSLKKSRDLVGQLYPVITDAKGNIIDGFHRLDDDPDWRRQKLEHIDSEEKLLVARAVANWNRRQVSREEKEKWINGLAELYLKQGYKISQSGNEVLHKIVETTGLSPRTVSRYLKNDFKFTDGTIATVAREPRVSASQAIVSHVGDKKYGESLVERHRAEVLEEETPKIREQTKKELLRDTSFIADVITNAPEILKEIPKTPDRESPFPALTDEQIEKTKEAMEQSDRELEEKRKDPKLIERSLLVKNWMAHAKIDGMAQSLSCPICGASTENLVWKCHGISVAEAEKMLKQKLEGQ